VKDRIVQTALKMVIEPIFEVQFRPGSYGFRPGRGCKDVRWTPSVGQESGSLKRKSRRVPTPLPIRGKVCGSV
jgi:hypothetical protein